MRASLNPDSCTSILSILIREIINNSKRSHDSIESTWQICRLGGRFISSLLENTGNSHLKIILKTKSSKYCPRNLSKARSRNMNNNTTASNHSAISAKKSSAVFYEFHVNTTERCIGITFTMILMLLTLFVNILVCFALTKGKQSFNTSYAFIMNLCVANVVIALFSMPWWVMVELFGSYQVYSMLGPDLFLFFLFIDIVGGVASIMSLTVISVARWLTVSHPLDWMHVLSFKRCIFIIAGVWIYGVVIGTLKFVKWAQVNTYSLIVFSVGFALPFSILVLAYGRMLLVAKYQHIYKTTKWQTKYDKSSEKVQMTRSIEWETKFKRNFKGSRTMAIVTGTFLISWLPFFAISLLYSVNPDIDLKAALAAKWLGYSNAMISPLVYTLLDKRLKRAVLRTIRKLKYWFCHLPWFIRVFRGRR